jgi:hypothetical protein
MAMTIHLDPGGGDDVRARLYDGDVVLWSRRPALEAVVEHVLDLLDAAFAPHEPRLAQRHLDVAEWVAQFAPVKPAVIHHPRTLALLVGVLDAEGFDLDQWYVDVPRVGYLHHPHRDTWWSAPMQQCNVWLPLYPYDGTSGMEYYPAWWDRPVPNSSDRFDYYEWNRVGRAVAATMIGVDTREQPRATVPIELGEVVRPVVPVGGAQLFAGCAFHGATGNDTGRTRFSMDWRIVHVGDVAEGRGPSNLDSHGRGTSLRDFRRASDLAPMPEALARSVDRGYEDAPLDGRVLVFGRV